MTDKELKHLRKIDLMEILLAQDRELEHLRAELESVNKRADLAEAVIWRFIGPDQMPEGSKVPSIAGVSEEGSALPAGQEGRSSILADLSENDAAPSFADPAGVDGRGGRP